MNLMSIMPLQAEATGGAGGYSSLIMMGLIFVVMYFFMIRPQQKKQKELVKFREGLKKGDRVITGGGIFAKVKDIKDNNIAIIEIASGVEISIDKSMLVRDTTDIAAK